MERVSAKSPRAAEAVSLTTGLQARFVEHLDKLSTSGGGEALRSIEWLRDQGRHGGGVRFVAVDTPVYGRAAVNFSSVHYDDDPGRALSSATALSTIIHPQSPRAPSVHIHISWTEMRDGSGYWRVMGDLNPAIEDATHRQRFDDAMRRATGKHYEYGVEQGAKYFFIPSLQRHRGVIHFYLEGFSSGDFDADRDLARGFGEAVIDEYSAILRDCLPADPPDAEELAAQLAYHSLYFLQVLTLDRGTTSGLLVHDQNDVGILGSLPARVNRGLLSSWVAKQTPPQDKLLAALVAALPDEHPCGVTDEVRARLAGVVREHYRAHPEALDLQARADIVPPTVQNHR